MPIRTSSATWKGNLKEGEGNMKLGSGSWEGKFSFGSRFDEDPGSNPDELIAAALAGCFSMALYHALDQAGYSPRRVSTRARVHLETGEEGPGISHIQLSTEAEVPEIDAAAFQEQAEAAKDGCPVSNALSAIPIQLEAQLVE